MEFFLNWEELSLNSGNSGNLINHWSMNWANFDPASHMSLACTVVVSCSLTQEIVGSSSFNNKYFLSLNSVKTFGKTPIRRMRAKRALSTKSHTTLFGKCHKVHVTIKIRYEHFHNFYLLKIRNTATFCSMNWSCYLDKVSNPWLWLKGYLL